MITHELRIHVVPVGKTERIHTCDESCECHPTWLDGFGPMVHNAFDGRESMERQGFIDKERPWILIQEDHKEFTSD